MTSKPNKNGTPCLTFLARKGQLTKAKGCSNFGPKKKGFCIKGLDPHTLPHLCPEDQAHALLQFKHMFTFNPNASDICGFPSPKTLSWNKSTDCCSWDGVHCEEMTGQVIELDLLCRGLQGKFHPNNSLFQLSNLKWLDLSYNNFYGSLISPKFGELSSLTHLDLSHSSFTGLIPAEISHLSKLYVLRIRSDDPYWLRVGPYNFDLLLKNLTQLRQLDLDSAQLALARGPGAQNKNGPGSDTMSRMDFGPNSTSKASSRGEDYPSPYKQTTSPFPN
ncbi:hypothetical protein FXO37_11388 [Capsicum annuum]|nr:hypothetical protein FXO37_11388 [Capsicum annuum]